MRFNSFVALAGGALIVAALPTQSQAQIYYSVSAGVSMPSGGLADNGVSDTISTTSLSLHDFPNEASGGYHLQGSIGYSLSTLPIDLRADLLFQNFDAVERVPGVNTTVGGEWYRQFGLLVNAIYDIPLNSSRVQPYVLAGTGILREWHSDRTYYQEIQRNYPINAGVGLSFPFRSVAWTVEARYMNLTGSGDFAEFQGIPITIGLRF
jgi:hypothetical protein